MKYIQTKEEFSMKKYQDYADTKKERIVNTD